MANITFYICIYELSNRAGLLYYSAQPLTNQPTESLNWRGSFFCNTAISKYYAVSIKYYVLYFDYGSFFIAHEVHIMLSINHCNDSDWLKFGFGLGLKIK